MKGRKKSKDPPGGRRSRNSSGLVRVTTWLRTPWSGREKRGGGRGERRKGKWGKRREGKGEKGKEEKEGPILAANFGLPGPIFALDQIFRDRPD